MNCFTAQQSPQVRKCPSLKWFTPTLRGCVQQPIGDLAAAQVALARRRRCTSSRFTMCWFWHAAIIASADPVQTASS
jgi:hypothetical protein